MSAGIWPANAAAHGGRGRAADARMRTLRREALRIVAMVALCFVALQLYFLARVAVMIVADPQSTTFQRSDAWRQLVHGPRFAWRHEWVPYERLSPHIKRAVIAAEDAGFVEHSGVQWEALERAWERNQAALERAEKANQRLRTRASMASVKPREPRLVGGSTITQQLAKNLFLSSERTLARKAQEFAVTLMLETLLSKQRILEIYLNNVEWGEGLYGAQSAARHYHRVGADGVTALQAARLAVMLPAPRRFEKRPASPYILGRAATIAARMGDVELP
jgi:monofunctional biosynthetic peptidoglycan transglycosylase